MWGIHAIFLHYQALTSIYFLLLMKRAFLFSSSASAARSQIFRTLVNYMLITVCNIHHIMEVNVLIIIVIQSGKVIKKM